VIGPAILFVEVSLGYARLEQQPIEIRKMIGGDDLLDVRICAKCNYVLAGLSLRRIIAKFAKEDGWMRSVDDDQLFDQLGRTARDDPRQKASPVVAGEQALIGAEMPDKTVNVLDQQVKPVGVDTFRFR
jgi:hypothetical protein